VSEENKEPIRYEDRHDLVMTEISKRRSKWFLASLSWMDFDDVSQIIASHISHKWSQWDQSRPLLPWINKIISNQFKNILRNNYSNFVRPCLSCPFNLSSGGGDGTACSFTNSKEQDSSCPLYAKWEKTKKSAYNIKMAVSMEGKTQEIQRVHDDSCDIIQAEQNLHKEMKGCLGERHYRVYEMLFIEHKSEAEVAKEMGYKTSEEGRSAGYKQIKNLKKQFKDKAKKLIATKDIFLDEQKKIN